MPQDLGAPLAARAGGAVRLAAQLGAVGEDRLEAHAVEAGDRKRLEAVVDRFLVAGVDDGSDRSGASSETRFKARLPGDNLDAR